MRTPGRIKMLIKLLDAEDSFLDGIFQIGNAIGNIIGGFHNPRQWKAAVWRQ